ncbi:MAG: GTP 3',8-cyclase MoaA, partial [Solirubrobacterales bacterium]
GHSDLMSDGYVPNREIRRIIESRFGPMSSVAMPGPGGPAEYCRIAGSPGFIGFISGRSSVFCDRCTRLRLTSDGQIKPCLYSACSYDVRELLRSGAGDEAVLRLLREAMRNKTLHTKLTASANDFLMQNIGG